MAPDSAHKKSKSRHKAPSEVTPIPLRQITNVQTNGSPNVQTNGKSSSQTVNGDVTPISNAKTMGKGKRKIGKKPGKEHSKKRAREENEDDPTAAARKLARKIGWGETLRREEAAVQQALDSLHPATESPVELELLPDSDSHFRQETLSLYLPLPPICEAYPLEGICAENLSPLLLTYFAPVKGTVISYGNVHLHEEPSAADSFSKLVDIEGISCVWTTVDLVVFAPRVGAKIEGYINVQTESHLGLVCWNLFNASIERKRLPKEWTWVEAVAEEAESVTSGANGAQRGEGCYCDADGKEVEGLLEFTVSEVEPPVSTREDRGIMTIRGTLLDEEGEQQALKEEREERENRRKKLIAAGIRGLQP